MTRIILLVSCTLVLLSGLTATSTPIVVIDPGHGGPGAWKYGANGERTEWSPIRGGVLGKEVCNRSERKTP